VVGILKAATSAMTLSQLADFRLVAAGFVNALANIGVFDKLLVSGIRRVPLSTTVGAATVGPIALIINEGHVRVARQSG
jgi:hypothetical protein